MNYTRVFLWSLLLLCVCVQVQGQETFLRNDVADTRPMRYAFVNAHIYVDHQTYIEHGSLLVVDGKVAAVGLEIDIPPGTPIIDLQARTIYPSFVDVYAANFGFEKPEGDAASGYYGELEGPQLFPTKEGIYGSNDAIKADFDAKDHLQDAKEDAKKLREVGFGAVAAFRSDGIAQGTSTLLTLSDMPLQERIVQEQAAAYFSFDKGSSTQEYPRSPIGTAALLRQMRYDAAWYASAANKEQSNLSLTALHNTRTLPQIIAVPHIDFALLADKIGKDTNTQYIIKGAGDEYQRIGEIARTGATFILPVNYPGAYEVEDPYKALDISVSAMKHWELAPANAALLHEAGVPFVFTAHGLEDVTKFLPHIREAISYGLPKAAALEALTGRTAALLQVSETVGSLQVGRWANFFIASGDIFEDTEAIIYEHWIQGKAHILQDKDAPDYKGRYSLRVDTTKYELSISGSSADAEVSLKGTETDTLTYKAHLHRDYSSVQLHFHPEGNPTASTRLTGWRSGNDLRGRGQDHTGMWVDWTAEYEGVPQTEDAAETEEKNKIRPTTGKIWYPFVAYGSETLPQAQTYLIQGATVWTNETQGRIEDADVVIQNGKIGAVGKGLPVPLGAVTIDGRGKHLTSGIIDEHAHLALLAVNEWAESISAQVRMSDVIDAADVNIYRQLAGGVTAAQLLHGSANPIGGQSALVKMRWGHAAEDMLIKNADPFIKFALGENVKRSNAPTTWNKRYPQTRMGVEQVMWDAFLRAKQYGETWARYKKPARGQSRGAAPRRDLQLEALWEILQGQRFITCHSYVQAEINMLMALADRFRVRVNTFTHILEGYKVADKMFKHGAAASTFSDWWAYKYEVREAIPYNAAIMHKAGLVVAINSDDDEMGRRLNQEAAKVIKYGGLSEEEAWKMVTLNPARILHLDDRMGSIRTGKDADVVLWSDNPLSVYAQAEKTFVDGALYYDISQADAKQAAIATERNRLIQKMLQAKADGKRTQPAPDMHTLRQTYHCSTQVTKQ